MEWNELEWHKAVEDISPHVVKITTPRGSGTGFLVSRVRDGSICGIATAAHVIDHAHYWEQPIRVQFANSGQTILLRQPDRAIVIEDKRDTAAILFEAKEYEIPETPFPLIDEGMVMKVGVRIGWLGYPAIGGSRLCFFSGVISALLEEDEAYFVDGVAINGVSGGPALSLGVDSPQIIGVVSAYMPNRATGETLPGLGIVRDVVQFQELLKRIRGLEEAKEQETPPGDAPPPPNPDTDVNQTSSRRAT